MDENKPRGFGNMDPDAQRAIARKGGRAAHEKGTAHKFSTVEARTAGSKGGLKVAADRSYMAEIGRRGGMARGQRRRDMRAAAAGDGDGSAAGNGAKPGSP